MLKSAGRFFLLFIYTVMKVVYTKVCTLPQDLIPLLKQRGLVIPNEQRAVSYLANIGYFRLSAYFYPLLKEPKTGHLYKDGATFDMTLDMYRFDRKLRILLFNEIEKIEVSIRSAMNNWISLCGHHNRTWNRENPLIPAPLKSPVFPWIDSFTTDLKRIYYRICIIKYLLFTVSPNNTFTQKLKLLLAEYPTIDIKAMGFPANWQIEPLWK